MPVTQNDLDWFAARLLVDIYDINRMTPEQIEQELHMASINNVWINAGDDTDRKPMTTIAEQLKAAREQMAAARNGVGPAVAECADAARVVLQETDKLKKDAADLRAEVAELTNGGPA